MTAQSQLTHLRYSVGLAIIISLAVPIIIVVPISKLILLSQVSVANPYLYLLSFSQFILTCFYSLIALIRLFVTTFRLRISNMSSREMAKHSQPHMVFKQSLLQLSPLILMQLFELSLGINFNKIMANFGLDFFYILIAYFHNYQIKYYQKVGVYK